PLAFGRLLQRRLCSRDFFSIVGGDFYLILPQFEPVDIGSVAVEPFRGGHRVDGLRRHLMGASGPQPDDGDVSIVCPDHGFSAQPGTSTMEKYGASSSDFSASRTEVVFAIVPRST